MSDTWRDIGDYFTKYIPSRWQGNPNQVVNPTGDPESEIQFSRDTQLQMQRAGGNLVEDGLNLEMAIGCPQSSSIVPMEGAAFNGALLREIETGMGYEAIAGFRIYGNKGLVGDTFTRNVFLIEASQKGAVPLRELTKALEKEALSAGATRLDIGGYAIINDGFLNPRIAARYGYSFERVNERTVSLTKVLR